MHSSANKCDRIKTGYKYTYPLLKRKHHNDNVELTEDYTDHETHKIEDR